MAEFLVEITAFFTEALSWVGKVIDTITEEPALTALVIALPLCGYAVGLVRRLIKL